MRSLGSLWFTVLGSAVLVLVIGFCVTETVISQSNEARCVEEKYYDEMEGAYLAEMKQLLTDKGYGNSGITMTRITDEEGMRSYTVSIHHKLINKLSKDEQEKLMETLGGIVFPDASCRFSHEFL